MFPDWVKKLFPKNTRPAPRRRPARARLGLEQLETRLVPAFTSALVSGQLVITGDNTGNVITLDHASGGTFARDNFGNIRAAANDVQITGGVVIKSGGGNDTVNIRAAVKPVTLDGVGGQDTVILGKGGNMQAIAAPVKIINLGGHTALTLDDSTDAVGQSATLDVKPDAVGAATGLFATITNLAPGAISIRGSDISSLVVRGGSGGNTFTVANTIDNSTFSGFTDTTLESGSSDDTINVLRTTGKLTVDTETADFGDHVVVGQAGRIQGIQGALNITASDRFGRYDLTLDDSADPTAQTVGVASSSVDFDILPSPIVFNSSANISPVVTINGGNGADNFFVSSMPGNLEIKGGGGNDSVFVGNATNNTLDGVTGNLDFIGGDGTDTVTINDQGTTTPQTFEQFITRDIERLNSAGPGTGDVRVDPTTESLVLNAGSGGNIFNIDDTESNVTETLNTGLGVDTVNVKGTHGALVVNGQGGADTVNVLPSSATSVRGDVTVTNQFNFSQLNVSDTSSTGRTVAMGIGADGFGFIDGLLPANVRYKAGDVSAVRVNAGTGADTFTISDTASNSRGPATLIFGNDGNDTFNVFKTTGRLTLDAGQGNDTFSVGSAANTLDVIQGAVTVDGEFGTDTLNVNDQGSTTPHTYTQTATTLDRSGAARITFAGIESLHVNKGAVLGAAPQAKDLKLTKAVKLGQFATLSGQLTDADPAAKLRLSVDWGDGSKPQTLEPGQSPFTVKHKYGHKGSYTVRVVWTGLGTGQSNSQDLALAVS
jgi:hypothetical protein